MIEGEPLIPWPRDADAGDSLSDVDGDRFMVFVPAIMSVGIIFSITTLLRDLVNWTGRRARARRTTLAAHFTVAEVLGEVDHGADQHHQTSARREHLLAALGLFTAAIVVAAVAVVGYVQEGGDVEGLAWLLALWLVAALGSAWLGAVSMGLYRTWPGVPWWAASTVRALPLSMNVAHPHSGPSPNLTRAVVISTTLVLALTGLVRHNVDAVLELDEPVLGWFVDAGWLDRLDTVDVFGSTVISIGFVVLIGLSAFRCRVMALVYPLAFVVAWGSTTMFQEIVERTRPVGFGEIESFPSGHMVQAVFLAGLLPTAAVVLLNLPGRLIRMSRAVLAILVVATGALRIHREDHWPLDAVGGILLGLAVALGTHWVLAHRWWHQGCSSCPWSPHPGHTPWEQGLFDLDPRTARRMGLAGALGAMAAAGALGIATTTYGVPTDPVGDGLGSAIAEPAQLGLAALMAVAGLVALRWKAIAAFVMAICASGLGLLAAVEYSPTLTFVLAALLFIPAFLTWLAWQPHETIGTIAALAVITTTGLTGTTFGSREVYGYYYGPTHASSTALPLESEAEWLWLGGVGADTATIVAGGLEPGATAELHHWETDAAPRSTVPLTGVVDATGLARFSLTGLTPATHYAYAVTFGGSVDTVQPDSTFHTFADGPQDLVIIAGACARNDSNGAVFEAIVGDDPDLYIMLGDLHYANLASNEPADHIRQYGRALSQPGQAAVFSSIPTAYVWDDHDYGGNDSDSTSPSREAALEAYRRAVPDYGVDPDPDAPIGQAFTVGRARVVLTDTRSQRSDTTMLGDAQLAWLIDEVTTSSPTHALVLWANPTPWISSAGPGSDDWSAHPEERQSIADAIDAAGVDNLVMVSGDAHMVALDDGTNSGYASNGSSGFPVLHGAALDRPGTVKGGPYSHGTFPGSGQYARIDITDDGGPTIGVRLSGHTWRGEELVHLELELDV